MKTLIKIHFSILFIIFITLINVSQGTAKETNDLMEQSAFSQEQPMVKGNYVVIGAFGHTKNVNNYIRQVKRKDFSPKFFFHKERGLYYVYAYRFKEKYMALRACLELRQYGSFFDDVWVFSYGIENNIKRYENIRLADTGPAEPDHKPKTPEEPEKVKETSPPVKKNQQIAKNKPQSSEVSLTKKSAADGNTETEKKPKRSKESEVIKQISKAEVGDLIIFNNLLFHRSAAILKSSSKRNLNDIYETLNTYKNMRIKIHGHTNGDFKGDVYKLADYDDRYFKLSGRNEVLKGDDILLSTERAKIIKKYLVQKGIDPGRVEVKGWGYKKMIYPKDHLKANQNRRVEIEILEK